MSPSRGGTKSLLKGGRREGDAAENSVYQEEEGRAVTIGGGEERERRGGWNVGEGEKDGVRE